MENSNLLRAQLLLEHGNFQEAEKSARQALSEDPQDGLSHAVLAHALVYQKRLREASDEIRQAIQLSPDNPYVHYVRAILLFQTKRWKDSKQAIGEAIRLAPWNPNYYGILSTFHFEDRNWQKALDAAEEGRSIDPDNDLCTQMMAAALIRLGRRAEVEQVLGKALERDPENDYAHANQGWARLHNGQYETAMMHFGEALRINPQNSLARNGILEALRARNPIYRIALRYFLWMSRMNTQTRWGIILGGYFLMQLVRMIGLALPGLAAFAFALEILYTLFAVFTWIARPMTDLLLRMDKNGRILLSRSQIQSTNFGLVLLALAGMLFGLGIITGQGDYFGGALGTLAMILPVFGAFQAPPGNKRTLLLVYTGGLTLVGIGAFGQALGSVKPAIDLSTIFIFGWIAFSWIANIVYSTR